MSINPIETAQHVCNKLITSEVGDNAVEAFHPQHLTSVLMNDRFMQ